MAFPGLPPEHVWHPLGRWGWANVKWCEETLMGWVTEPANTWSNLAWILAAVAIVFRKPVPRHPLVKLMPMALVGLGLLSGFYHATNAWITQLGDFLGMYLVAAIPFLINLERLGVKNAGTRKCYILTNIFGVVATAIGYYAHFPIQIIFAFFFGGTALMEALLRSRAPARSYRNFFATLGAFAVAATFSALDVTRTMCEPENHFIQGHALWHCFGAIGVYFADGYCRDTTEA